MSDETRWMLRCGEGHFVCHVRRFYDAERGTAGGIADAWCNGCEDYVPIDSREHFELLRRWMETHP